MTRLIIEIVAMTLIVTGLGVMAARGGSGMETKAGPGQEGVTVALPQPRFESTTSVEQALRERRSKRDYRSGALTLEEIGQLLWAAQGITSPRGLRTAPSAGALYPLETYVVAGNVRDLPAGVYRYKPAQHSLVRVAAGDIRGELSRAAHSQSPVAKAPASIVFSAVLARTTSKYGQRGIRYVHMDVGHAAQNVYLQAVSLRLGTVVMGAFDDDGVKRVMMLPLEEAPLSIMPVGRV